MDQRSKASRILVSSERSRWTSFVAGAIGMFLLVAILKPWSIAPSDRGTPTATASRSVRASSLATVTGEASGTPAISDPNAVACLGGETNQLVALERWIGREVRSWVLAPEIPGAGPLDRRLTPVLFFSTHVIGIGVCGSQPSAIPSAGSSAAGSGSGGVGGEAARLIDVRSIVNDGRGDVAADLGVGLPITVPSGGPDAAMLYGPPGTTSGSSTAPRDMPSDSPGAASGTPQPTDGAASSAPNWPTWAPGDYAIGFRFDGDGPTVTRWLRVRIVRSAGDQ